MFVRSKYRCGLMAAGSNREVKTYDEKWDKAAFRGLLKMRTQIKGGGRRKDQELIQLEKLQWLKERETGRMVRKWWKKAADGKGGKNQAHH